MAAVRGHLGRSHRIRPRGARDRRHAEARGAHIYAVIDAVEGDRGNRNAGNLEVRLERLLAPATGLAAESTAIFSGSTGMQLQFVTHLIGQDADDSASVTEHTTVLSYLLDRYFGTHGPDWRVPSPQDVRIEPPPAYVPDTDNGQFLNSAILESLPDRVVVLTRDYRFLYSNPANCAYLNKKPMELIGRHLSEFIGEELFAACAKYKLDDCFAGEQIDYAYECPNGSGGPGQVRCRMVKESIPALRRVVAAAISAGLPVPALTSALTYFDAYRQGRGTANLIQAQRDFFGAHGFDRLDGKDFHHGPWGSGAASF